jgi:hypothetical protein
MFHLKINKNLWGKYFEFIQVTRLFTAVSQDDIPQVRKVAAIVLNDMIKLIPKAPETELLNIFSKFFKDDQDSVRMQGIDSCVIFAKHLPVAVTLSVFSCLIESECLFVAICKEVRRRQELENKIFGCR